MSPRGPGGHWTTCNDCGHTMPRHALVTTVRAWATVPLCRSCDGHAYEAWERRQKAFKNEPRLVTFETVGGQHP